MGSETPSRRGVRGALGFREGNATEGDEQNEGVLCPLCFLVGTVGVYTCAPECTNHFGSKGSESGTRRGLVPDDGKAEKHGFRNAEPARRARSSWFFARATRRKSRKTCAPKERAGEACAEPLVFREGNAAEGDEQNEGVLCPLCFLIGTVGVYTLRGSCAPSVRE